jgi:hypothetical protein
MQSRISNWGEPNLSWGWKAGRKMEIDRPVSTVSGYCPQRPRFTGVFFGTVSSGEALCL